MIDALVLDTGVLGELVHPRSNVSLVRCISSQAVAGVSIVIPEIADYELRRNLILEGFEHSIRRLNELKSTFAYLPLDTDAMLAAARLWASARKKGRPTADPRELDGDVILAAQALQISGAVVITENIGHLAQFVSTTTWRELVKQS